MPIRLICVAGARPNFMKVAPLFLALDRDPAFHPILVHTGQHYDDQMSGQFLRELGLPSPHHHLSVGSGSHAQQTAEVMKRFEPVVLEEKPDGVIVAGDINSTLACALVAKKLQIPVIHVEAGLRSFDRSMPEEINRLMTDSISDLLLVTEQSAIVNLRAEGIPNSRIAFPGNLMIDSLRKHADQAKSSTILKDLGLDSTGYGLVTLHRPGNVDDPATLSGLLETLDVIARDLPLVFPVHPRTAVRIQELSLQTSDRIQFIKPVGYVDFLSLMMHSCFVFTDSGGIQEETTVLGITCLTLRENTERPVTLEEGTNLLAGTGRDSILKAWSLVRAQARPASVPKFWDGNAAERCVQALRSYYCLLAVPALQ